LSTETPIAKGDLLTEKHSTRGLSEMAVIGRSGGGVGEIASRRYPLFKSN